MINLLNFPHNLHEMLQDEIQTLATNITSPQCDRTGKEHINTANEQIVENPPTPSVEHKSEPKSTKISA
jgi:hypothetical protein